MNNQIIQLKERKSSYGQFNIEVVGDWDKVSLKKNAIIRQSENGLEVIGVYSHFIDIKCDSALCTLFKEDDTSEVKYLCSLKNAEYSTSLSYLNSENCVRLSCDLTLTVEVKNQSVQDVKTELQDTLYDFGIKQWAKSTLQEHLETFVKKLRDKEVEYYTSRFGLLEDEWLQAASEDTILSGLYQQQQELDKAYNEALTKNKDLLKTRIRQMLDASYNEF